MTTPTGDDSLQLPQVEDCASCKVISAGGCTVLGSYLLYQARQLRGMIFRVEEGIRQGRVEPKIRRKMLNRKWALQLVGAASLYVAVARIFYLPPFTELRPRPLAVYDTYDESRRDERLAKLFTAHSADDGHLTAKAQEVRQKETERMLRD